MELFIFYFHKLKFYGYSLDRKGPLNHIGIIIMTMVSIYGLGFYRMDVCTSRYYSHPELLETSGVFKVSLDPKYCDFKTFF